MSLTATYNDDLSRVQLAVSGAEDGTVDIERSTNQLYWQVVRGGLALPIISGAASLDDYEFAGDVLNYYRVRAVDPAGGLLLPGSSGDYADTPDHASLDIIGDIDIRVEATADDWTPTSDETLIAKYGDTGNQRSYRFEVRNTDGILRLQWTTDGTAGTILTAVSTVAPTVSDGGRLAVRVTMDVDNGSSGRDITFYTASSINGPWTQLGSVVTGGATTSIYAGTAPLEVGARDGGTTAMFAGIIHAVQVYDGIGGTLVADPDFAAQTTDAASFADSTSKTWTVHGSARLYGDTVFSASLTPNLAGQVWLKSIRYPFLNRPVTVTNWSDIDRAARIGLHEVSGRSYPVVAADLRRSRGFTLQIMTSTLTLARDMDLILASGSTFFVHIPSDCPVPGGYVEIMDTTQARRTRSARSDRRYFDLPCRIVAAPGPDVIGGTMTYGALISLYGDYANVLAANPTYADLLALMASPDDLVVL